MPVKNLLKTLCDRFDRVESSGANYIRYANGIQICWYSQSGMAFSTKDIPVGWIFNFPVPFSSDPVVVADCTSGNRSELVGGTEVINQTHAAGYFCMRFNTLLSPFSGVARVIAIGFWK